MNRQHRFAHASHSTNGRNSNMAFALPSAAMQSFNFSVTPCKIREVARAVD